MDCITAISTAPGAGGIAIIRLSGDDVLGVLHRAIPESARRELTPRRSTLVRTELDDMMLTLYPAPHSYTGEDVVEIACHGSLYIQNELLRILIEAGARLAQPGEFTQRAFVNGKMDLTEAEAVADLIASESEAEQRLALRQLRGGISNEMSLMRSQLIDLTSLLELELDFSDHEDVEFADRTKLHTLLDQIEEHITHLTDTFRAGNAIRNGIAVAIVGPTNAGKSTLLNAILGEERAIVSDIAGTTRDTIEEYIVLGSVRYRLIDTAGIRDTSDTIERLGVERSLRAIEMADIVVAVDTQVDTTAEVIYVHNKCDLGPGAGIAICAKEGKIQPLIDALIRVGQRLTESHGNVLISNARHMEALQHALTSIRTVREGLALNLSAELITPDLHDVLDALGSITGEISNDEILGNIFRKFCIGK